MRGQNQAGSAGVRIALTAIHAWVKLAILCLMIGSIFALYLGIARSPMGSVSPTVPFHHILSGHVIMRF